MITATADHLTILTIMMDHLITLLMAAPLGCDPLMTALVDPSTHPMTIASMDPLENESYNKFLYHQFQNRFR